MKFCPVGRLSAGRFVLPDVLSVLYYILSLITFFKETFCSIEHCVDGLFVCAPCYGFCDRKKKKKQQGNKKQLFGLKGTVSREFCFN